MGRTPVQYLSIGAGAALLVLALFGAVAFASVSRMATQQEAVRDANDAIAQIDQIFVATADAERAGTEFMLTARNDSYEAFRQAQGRVEDALDAIRVRAEDRPRERAVLDTLGPALGDRFQALNAGIAQRKRDGAKAAVTLTDNDSTRATRGGILPLLNRLREEELVVLAERTRLMAENGRTSKAVILAGSILAFLLAAVALTPVTPNMIAKMSASK